MIFNPRVIRLPFCGESLLNRLAWFANCGEQLAQEDRRKPSGINPNVKLPPKRSKTPVAMTMQVERTAVNTIPGPKRIMAEDKHRTFNGEFGVGLDACPI